ncbi:MAG TPA: ATP-dependent Clp protease proteolytic subunit, partial [Flavobacterium sp.]|nr:ATP-dependent Clp protease proteolytic subunit [Flavobacterium sp.]
GSGIVASIATVIFMAGEKRLIRENTPFMIHLPWGGSMGTADELEQFAGQLRTIEKKMVGFYKKALNVGEEAILPLLKNETWLTGTQLTALGFTTSQQVKAAAKAFIKPNSTMTGTFTEKDRHWMESLFERVLGKFRHNAILNKVIQDATGAEIDFTELPDDGVIEVGAIATVDGKPAQGEYLLPDGFTYVFEAGELVEIIEPEEDAEAAALRAENKALKRQLTTIKSEVLALKRQVSSKFNVDGKKAATIKMLRLANEQFENLILQKDEELAALAKEFNSLNTVVKYKTITTVDTIVINYPDTLPCSFEIKGSKINDWYSFNYKSNQYGVEIDSLKTITETTLITGFKRKWFLGKDVLTTDITNSNPHIEVTQLKAAEVIVTQPWYKKWYIWFSAGLVGGFLITK